MQSIGKDVIKEMLFWFLTLLFSLGWGLTAAMAQTAPADAAVAAAGSHAGRFTKYEGTKTCLQCHREQALEMHGSVHYQWRGDTRDLVDPAAPLEGKLGGINDFCIYPNINWIGKVTNVSGARMDTGCARCHTGLGVKPAAAATAAQLANIDCLMCHAAGYKRKVQKVNAVFRFVPDPVAMGMSITQAAQDISKPDKNACLNCHTKSGGGDNFKRGDIEEAHRSATRDFDVHLASKTAGGAGLECTSCHTASGHRIAGRGSDLKPRDSVAPVECSNCHGTAPHDGRDINRHTARVNCTVCHIPQIAKVAPTDVFRNWSAPGELVAARGLYDPAMERQNNVAPVYRFWNGQSKFYNFGDEAVPESNGNILMSTPLGNIGTPGAKIYAFKKHEALQPIDPVNRRILPLKIAHFYETGTIGTAVAEGVKAVGWPYNGYEFARTERYLGVFHEVSPSTQALQCTNCHGGTRLDFAALGYTPKAQRNGKPLCQSCHGNEGSPSFTRIHSIHVDGESFNCSQCHNFTKAN